MIKVNLKKKRPSLNYLFEDAESTQRALKYAKDSWRKMQEKTENAVSDFANTILNSNGIDAETRRSAQSILADYAKNGIKGSEVDTEMPFELSNGETISFTPLYIKRNCETVIELMKRSTGDFQEVSDLLNDIKFIYGVKPNNGCETAFFYGGVIYFYMPFLAHFIKGYSFAKSVTISTVLSVEQLSETSTSTLSSTCGRRIFNIDPTVFEPL